MFAYMIIDDTECETIYFQDFFKAMDYFNRNNHTMTLFIKTNHRWKEIQYKRRL